MREVVAKQTWKVALNHNCNIVHLLVDYIIVIINQHDLLPYIVYACFSSTLCYLFACLFVCLKVFPSFLQVCTLHGGFSASVQATRKLLVFLAGLHFSVGLMFMHDVSLLLTHTVKVYSQSSLIAIYTPPNSSNTEKSYVLSGIFCHGIDLTAQGIS